MSDDVDTRPSCPECGELAPNAHATWCEACGADLAGMTGSVLGAPCVECGAGPEMIVEGFCGNCGRKQPGPRDHLSEDLGSIAAATDKGHRHRHNEDAYSIASVDTSVGTVHVAVVCDGVSSTDHSQDASQLAADAARDRLVAALESAVSIEDIALESEMDEAIEDAQAAAASAPFDESGQGPASTTIVASVLTPSSDGYRSVTGWLGDSRAYWIDAESAEPLTVDDEIDGSISRWLGRDAGDVTPSIHVGEWASAGQLLLCTDGLWRYAAEPPALHALIGDLSAADHTSAAIAQGLVTHALESGGHDNVTVALITVDPSTMPTGDDSSTRMQT